MRPVVYRSIRIDVGGEVKRPGHYTLSGESNLSPQFINVFVSGRVAKPGGVVLPQSTNRRPNKMEKSATRGTSRLLEWEFRDPSLSL